MRTVKRRSLNQGLYEFKVMLLGVMNAPAVFQHLMLTVLNGMQSDRGKEFISVYLDDVTVFSESLQDYVSHLRAVLDCLKGAGLKLDPKKCKFVCDEVEYLGYLVTLSGLKSNNQNLDAVRNFFTPTNMKQLRQFLGLTSHYCHFIMGYAKVAHPLYLLTKTGAVFQWIADCEAAFENLRSKLLTATVLAYPDFDQNSH